nr:MAG TPA: hypothetical protein [Crassvirales sp.]
MSSLFKYLILPCINHIRGYSVLVAGGVIVQP